MDSAILICIAAISGLIAIACSVLGIIFFINKFGYYTRGNKIYKEQLKQLEKNKK